MNILKPTMELRFKKQEVENKADGTISMKKILQQCWRDQETGMPMWKNVPVEDEYGNIIFE